MKKLSGGGGRSRKEEEERRGEEIIGGGQWSGGVFCWTQGPRLACSCAPGTTRSSPEPICCSTTP
eukprot:209032-Pyramimonas_sp.AAC.1